MQRSIDTRWYTERVQLVAAKLAAMHQLLPKIASVPADAKTASVFRNIDAWCSLAHQASSAPLSPLARAPLQAQQHCSLCSQ